MQRLGECSIEWLYGQHERSMGIVICEHCGAIIKPEENYLKHFYWIDVKNQDFAICKLKLKETSINITNINL